MNRPLTRLLAVLGFGVVASQAGHLLVYQLEFGSSAWAVQSQGAHAYFPLVARAGFGLAAIGLLAALLLIGLSRLASTTPATRVVTSPDYFKLLSVLFTFQIACFVGQETLESMAAGEPATSPIGLVLIGAVGQLPVAAIAALALKWLATRFETALLSLRSTVSAVQAVLVAPDVVQPRWLVVAQPALVDTCPNVYVKRGPPSNLRD